MKTPRDLLLEKHRAAEPRLDALRQSVLRQAAAPARGERPAAKLSFGQQVWAELILPVRRIWAGLAAAWAVIVVMNVLGGDTRAPALAQQTPAAPEVLIAFQESSRLLAEENAPPVLAPAEPPRFVPRPRSERAVPCKMA